AQRGRAAEPAAGRRRPRLGDQDGPRRVVPPRRDHLDLVHAEPDYEVGRAEQRPLHRAAGDKTRRLGGGVRQDTAGPGGVQRREAGWVGGRGGPPRAGGPRPAAVGGTAPGPSSPTGRRAARPASASTASASTARAAVSSVARGVWDSTPFSAHRRPGRPS